MLQLHMTENTIVTRKMTSCDYENTKQHIVPSFFYLTFS